MNTQQISTIHKFENNFSTDICDKIINKHKIENCLNTDCQTKIKQIIQTIICPSHVLDFYCTPTKMLNFSNL